MTMVRMAPLALFLCMALPARATWISPFISEFHYDNAGSDVGEFVAVSGSPGADLSGWQIVLYNGSDGGAYRSLSLSGRLDGGGGGLAEAHWAMAGMQNGPDAIALVSAADAVVDFVAYEAAVVASAGPAAGMAARLLPVAEDGTTPLGSALQRVGELSEWSWVSADATPGAVNIGLLGPAVVSIPASAPWLLGLAGLSAWTVVGARRRVVA